MNKKCIVVLSVLVIALLLFLGYETLLSSKGTEGSKEVTIHVIIENEDINETFIYNTNHQFLLELLEENQEELGITFETSDFGTMITGMIDYVASPDKKEFFLISINEEDAMMGAAEIPLKDNDVYKLELTNY